MTRYLVIPSFLAHVGDCTVIVDTATPRRIIVAGTDHFRRAEQRAAKLEREARDVLAEEAGA